MEYFFFNILNAEYYIVHKVTAKSLIQNSIENIKK